MQLVFERAEVATARSNRSAKRAGSQRILNANAVNSAGRAIFSMALTIGPRIAKEKRMQASLKGVSRSSKPQKTIGGRPASPHKRRKLSTSVPEEAMVVIDILRKRLRMSTTQLLNSLLMYACWCEKEHKFTGDAVIKGGAKERALWAEIITKFGMTDKAEEKGGRFFSHAIARVLRDKLGGITEELDRSPRRNDEGVADR